MEENNSEIDLKKSYIQAAKIVAVHGDKYLPVFERLEREYKTCKKKRETLRRVLEIACKQL